MGQIERNKFQNVKTIKNMEDHTGKNISEDQEVHKEQYNLGNSSEEEKLKAMEVVDTRDSARTI